MTKYIKYAAWSIFVIAVLFLFLRFAGSFFVSDFIAPQYDNNKDAAAAGVGEEAPYFSLSKISGGSVNRSDIAGTPAVLVFWATWQSDSADQIKILDDYRARTEAVSVRIIAVNSQENKSAVSSFLRRGGYNIEVALDQTGEVGNQYGIQTLPTSFFIDKDGIIKEIFIGVMSEAMLVDKAEKILR